MKTKLLLGIIAIGSVFVMPTVEAADYTLKERISCFNTIEERMEVYRNFNSYMTKKGVPIKNTKGLRLNEKEILNNCIAAYGEPHNNPGEEPKMVKGKAVYRYIGYSYNGLQLSNPFFPNDTSKIPANYTKITAFISSPWKQKDAINAQDIPNIKWGDPTWKKESDINVNDPKRLLVLQNAIDMPYVAKNPNSTRVQRYFLEENVLGTKYINGSNTKALSKIANIQENPHTFTGGQFSLYRKSGSQFFYHTYYLAPEKSVFEIDDALLVKDIIVQTITANPAKPKRNGDVSMKITIAMTGEDQGKTYYNVPVEYGWKLPDGKKETWCTVIPEMKVGQTLNLTINNLAKTSCDFTQKENFNFPNQTKATFYINVNYEKNNPTRETSYANNKKELLIFANEFVMGEWTCGEGVYFCFTSYPNYPSTLVEGGQGHYFKATYNLMRQGDMVPKTMRYKWSILDPRGKKIYSGKGENTLPATCYDDTPCKTVSFYIDKSSTMGAKLPSEQMKIRYKNPGRYTIIMEVEEDQIELYGGTSTATVKRKQTFYYSVTGISNGVGFN